MNAVGGGSLNEMEKTLSLVVASETHIDPNLASYIDLFIAKVRSTSNTRTSSGTRMSVLQNVGWGKLNVGVWIEHNIFHRTTKAKAPICYPGLVLQLCNISGVNLQDFRRQGAKTFNFGPTIPLPQDLGGAPVERFTHLACFDNDKDGEVPTDSASQATGSSTASKKRQRSTSRGSSTARPRVRQRPLTSIREDVPESGATESTQTRVSSLSESGSRPTSATAATAVVPQTPVASVPVQPPRAATTTDMNIASEPINMAMVEARIEERIAASQRQTVE